MIYLFILSLRILQNGKSTSNEHQQTQHCANAWATSCPEKWLLLLNQGLSFSPVGIIYSSLACNSVRPIDNLMFFLHVQELEQWAKNY